MDLGFRDSFSERWARFFPGAEPPIAFYYADFPPDDSERVQRSERRYCVFADLNRVRQGASLAFRNESVACFGGRRYLGFAQEIRPDFEYFLSCGIPGKLEGERYKKTPDMVRGLITAMPSFTAPNAWTIFKRWDKFGVDETPQVVVFFAVPDALSGLFTLANFDETELDGVIAPMGSGCSSIVMQPFLQGKSPRPRAVLGLFDPSARPCAPPDVLTFAVPMAKFERMVANMDESFLITETWKQMQARMARRIETGKAQRKGDTGV
jgi:uncharacterized protein (DUF169 family)